MRAIVKKAMILCGEGGGVMETESIWRIEVKMRRKVFGDIQALDLVRNLGQEVKRQDGDRQEVI